VPPKANPDRRLQRDAEPPPAAKNLEQQLRKHLDTHRLTHKSLVRALLAVGVEVDTHVKSGHVVLHYHGEHAAITSSDRKASETWQAKDVLSKIKKLGIPLAAFFAVIIDKPAARTSSRSGWATKENPRKR
jgi:hypothetical protein